MDRFLLQVTVSCSRPRTARPPSSDADRPRPAYWPKLLGKQTRFAHSMRLNNFSKIHMILEYGNSSALRTVTAMRPPKNLNIYLYYRLLSNQGEVTLRKEFSQFLSIHSNDRSSPAKRDTRPFDIGNSMDHLRDCHDGCFSAPLHKKQGLLYGLGRLLHLCCAGTSCSSQCCAPIGDRSLTKIQLNIIFGSVANSYQVQYGFGRHVEYVTPTIRSMTIWTTISEIQSYTSIFLAKMSVSLFILRFIKRTHQRIRILLYCLMVFLTCSTIAAMITVSLQCIPLRKLWHKSLPGHCYSPSISALVTRIFGGMVPLMEGKCSGKSHS